MLGGRDVDDPMVGDAGRLVNQNPLGSISVTVDTSSTTLTGLVAHLQSEIDDAVTQAGLNVGFTITGDPDDGLDLVDSTFTAALVPFGAVNFVSQGDHIHGGQTGDILDSKPVSGAVQTIVAHPSNMNVVWIGTVNGSIWRTRLRGHRCRERGRLDSAARGRPAGEVEGVAGRPDRRCRRAPLPDMRGNVAPVSLLRKTPPTVSANTGCARDYEHIAARSDAGTLPQASSVVPRTLHLSPPSLEPVDVDADQVAAGREEVARAADAGDQDSIRSFGIRRDRRVECQHADRHRRADVEQRSPVDLVLRIRGRSSSTARRRR